MLAPNGSPAEGLPHPGPSRRVSWHWEVGYPQLRETWPVSRPVLQLAAITFPQLPCGGPGRALVRIVAVYVVLPGPGSRGLDGQRLPRVPGSSPVVSCWVCYRHGSGTASGLTERLPRSPGREHSLPGGSCARPASRSRGGHRAGAAGSGTTRLSHADSEISVPPALHDADGSRRGCRLPLASLRYGAQGRQRPAALACSQRPYETGRGRIAQRLPGVKSEYDPI